MDSTIQSSELRISNLLELVHQETKVERQVQEDVKYSKYSAYSSKNIGNNTQASPNAAPTLSYTH